MLQHRKAAAGQPKLHSSSTGLVSPRSLALALCLITSPAVLSAQQIASTLTPPELPDAPSALAEAPAPQATASLSGTAKDLNGSPVAEAQVTLQSEALPAPRSISSAADGAFLFADLPPGPFKLSITLPGLAVWTITGVLHSGQNLNLSDIAMSIASTSTEMDVTASPVEIAAAQVKLEEKQRVLGVFPNFYATYIWNAAPLTRRQKFSLAWKSSIDPVTVVVTGITAGVEQDSDDFSGYGQGAQGYAKRFGAAYADSLSSTFIGGAILPSLFHQDPRYFVMGSGSIRHRALYAIVTPVVCRGDNHRWQPNYSNVLGNLASAGISNAYYPASDRHGANLTFENALIGTASGAASSLIQEFFLHRITPHLPNYGSDSKP